MQFALVAIWTVRSTAFRGLTLGAAKIVVGSLRINGSWAAQARLTHREPAVTSGESSKG